MPRPRVFRNRNHPLQIYDNYEFKQRYRLDKETVIEIAEIIGHQLESATLRNQPLSAMNKILICLRFFATGSFQQVLADQINVSQPTVSRIVPVVTRALASLHEEFITMPRTDETRRKTQLEFYNINQFPCVIGAVDGTHIRIQSPGGLNGELYRNRKGWYSYNVQCVCGANLKFLHIIARWLGSVHDATIIYDSPLRIDFENNLYPNSVLLGDSGYALMQYMLTPVLNPNTVHEQGYNEAHIKTRNVIERAFGIWKRRFPCLSLGMKLKKQTVLQIITATAVLHNLCIILKDELPHELPPIEQVDLNVNENIVFNKNVNNNIYRNIFINNNF
ncbi:hypothetical protein RN001_012431 [Aquatica leii]|uniref:Putative nuclease HARBI1 n=1 Tax=Aquatica leii TaxID=1421715 RepID=A0AAN7P320_9COLE|nr:hypothetical protein RN001_012431 [Aquatica leii]